MTFDPQKTADKAIAKIEVGVVMNLAQLQLAADITQRIAVSVRVENMTSEEIADVLAALTLCNDTVLEAT